jgi:hypothetical protein
LGQSDSEADSDVDEEDFRPAKAAKRRAKTAAVGGGVSDVRQRASAPEQPVPASALLEVLHACPTLIGEWRSAGQLCSALAQQLSPGQALSCTHLIQIPGLAVPSTCRNIGDG